MKKATLLFALLFLLCLPQFNFAQEKKPKVVLVLSGGGAKGVAHIPLLQALDSLHIVPDLIVGNSMGSVMGGLYAMGYSGDSIAELTNRIEWDKLLGGGISLEEVSIEEKNEFQRYLLGINIKNGSPESFNSILSDQNLRQYLSELTYPVHNVKNFDNLSIPFRALATDIVTGKEVVLSDGNLGTAIRASMSLPAVFNAVPYKGTLLVDGGVLNNFPTDVAQQLGADFIIGSDVGGGMEPADKLNSFVTVLVQASMLTSNVKDPEQRQACDILVDHLPNLKYSTGDFVHSKEIYEEGKIATAQNLQALTALADRLKGFKQRTHELPKVDSAIVFDTIVYKNVSEDNLKLVMERANFKPNVKYTPKDIADGMDRAMGTNLFKQIYNSSFYYDDDRVGFELNFVEMAKNQANLALHYDTYRGVGLLLNYTGRNILGESSRLIVTADIAEQPRLRVAYQKIFGSNKNWWWASEAYGENLIQEFYIDNNLVDDMKYNAYQFNNQINKNLNSLKSFVGIGLNYQYTYIKPKTDPDFSDNNFYLNNYSFNNIEVNAHYTYNGLNKVFFATEGCALQANLSRSLLHEVNYVYSDAAMQDFDGSTNGFTKLNLNFEKRFKVYKKITGIFGAATAFIFQDKLKSNQGSFAEYGYAAKYFLGGSLQSPDKNSYQFRGLNDDELNLTQFMKVNFDLQTNPIPKIFITPHLDVATVGFGTFDDYIGDAFSSDADWQLRSEPGWLVSGGATLAYYSLLGPITFDASWVNNLQDTNLFFSVGLLFNPSN